MADSNLENPPPIGFDWLKNLPDLPAPEKSEETQNPSFLLFGILNGTSFVFTLVCLGFTIFSQANGNTDLNIFLWITSGCAYSLCIVELLFLELVSKLDTNSSHDCICDGRSSKNCQDMPSC